MGSKESKTTQENKPPKWSRPLFKESAAEASRLYNAGIGGNTYMGSTVAPLSANTLGGIDRLNQAAGGWDTSATRNQFGALGQGAMANPFMAALGQTAGGQAIDTSYFKDVFNRAGAPSSAETNLQGYASGANLQNGGNPYYKERLERDLSDTAAQVQSLFSGAGRYGSGANNEVLTDSLAGQRIAALENDWNREQANQFNAVNAIDGARQAGFNTQLGAASGIAGAEGQNFNSMLAALTSGGQMYGQGISQGLQATGAQADLDQRNFTNQMEGANAVLQGGKILDDQWQRELSDEVARAYAVDNEGWTKLGLLQSAAAGSAGPYGTQIATSRQPMNILQPLATVIGAGK